MWMNEVTYKNSLLTSTVGCTYSKDTDYVKNSISDNIT